MSDARRQDLLDCVALVLMGVVLSAAFIGYPLSWVAKKVGGAVWYLVGGHNLWGPEEQ